MSKQKTIGNIYFDKAGFGSQKHYFRMQERKTNLLL